MARVVEEYAAAHSSLAGIYFIYSRTSYTLYCYFKIFGSRLEIHDRRLQKMKYSELLKFRKRRNGEFSLPCRVQVRRFVANIYCCAYCCTKAPRFPPPGWIAAKPRFRCARARSSVADQMAPHQHSSLIGIIAPWIMVTRWTWPICYLPRVRMIRNGGARPVELDRRNEQ